MGPRPRAIGLIVSILICLAVARTTGAQTQVWLSLDPPTSPTSSGAVFTTVLKLTSVGGAVGAVDVSVRYDPAVLRLLEFDTQGGAGFFPDSYARSPLATPGQARIVGFQTTQAAPPTSPAVVGTLRWEAIGPLGSTTTIDIVANTVVDANLGRVEALAYGQRIDVSFTDTTGLARYFAEGATSGFFDTRLALLNPGTSATTATLTFSRAGATPVVAKVPVPAHTRVTVDAKAVSGLGAAEFSTHSASDQSLVVDRTMSWDERGYGAHSERAVTAPAVKWYLAEGATHSGFNLFYLLQNPSAMEALVRVRYLRPSGTPLEKTYALGPNSRTNVWVNLEEFPGLGRALASTDVSAVLESTNGVPVIVERAMYLDVPGQVFGAGHESAGITAPATEWFLAEGATGDYFDLFVLVANPEATAAEVEATYLLPDGTTLVKPYIVGAASRFNIWVDYEDGLLADTAVSTTIRSRNGVPIIVERAMWWPGPTASTWYEAHNSAGAVTTGTKWAVAEGEVDLTRNLETYILVANTSATPADVKVTLLFEDGTSVEQTYRGIPARSRFNVPVGGFFPQAAGKRFGAVVESLGSAPAQIVVERAVYWDAAGQSWAAGTNALATKLQ